MENVRLKKRVKVGNRVPQTSYFQQNSAFKLNDREIRQIRAFIKQHYREMYLKWQEIADTGYYGE